MNGNLETSNDTKKRGYATSSTLLSSNYYASASSVLSEDSRPSTSRGNAVFDYKTAQLKTPYTMDNKLTVLSKILTYMKDRHINGDTYPISLEDISEELNLPMSHHISNWLDEEGLPKNLKISVIATQPKKYIYRPKYDVNHRGKGLLELLRRHHYEGKGGVLKSELEESMKPEVLVKVLARNTAEIIQVARPSDRKVVLFWKDPDDGEQFDEAFQNYWRSIPVAGLTAKGVQDHLEKNLIQSMSADMRVVAPKKQVKKAGGSARRTNRIRDNAHVQHELMDFSELDYSNR